jgi:hypothetical protein
MSAPSGRGYEAGWIGIGRVFHGNEGLLATADGSILNYLFEHLPAASTVEQIEALLPWNLKTMLDEQKKSPQAAQPSVT